MPLAYVKARLKKLQQTARMGWFDRFEGVIIVITIIRLLEAFKRAGNEISNPLLILQTVVVYAALRGAVQGAIFTVIKTWLYILWNPGTFLSYNPDRAERLVIATLTIFISELIVGYLRSRLRLSSFMKAPEKAEEELKCSEERYKTFIEWSSQAI